jgi:hypothetical protein
METLEMHFLRAVAGYRMTDHKHNKNREELWKTHISKIINN